MLFDRVILGMFAVSKWLPATVKPAARRETMARRVRVLQEPKRCR